MDRSTERLTGRVVDLETDVHGCAYLRRQSCKTVDRDLMYEHISSTAPSPLDRQQLRTAPRGHTSWLPVVLLVAEHPTACT